MMLAKGWVGETMSWTPVLTAVRRDHVQRMHKSELVPYGCPAYSLDGLDFTITVSGKCPPSNSP